MFGIRSIPAYTLTKRDRRFIYSIILPALCENLITQLFGMVDTIMLGHTPESAKAIAAVGMTVSPINIVVCVLSSFCIGTTAAVAWYTGADESENARAAARQSLVLLSAIGLIVTALALVFASPIIRFAGARADTFDDALAYYRIVAAGFFIQTVTFSVSASLRGVGITRLPMLYNLLAAGLNVVLNYVLIYGRLGLPAMGVRGAALATTLSKVPAFLIALGIMFFGKTPVSCRRGDDYRFTKKIMNRVLRVGITAALEQVILQTGALLSNRIAATVPTDDFAANQIAITAENIGWAPGSAAGVASATAVGQALGEGRADKARAMTRLALHLSIAMTAVYDLFLLFGGKWVALLFTTELPVALTAGRVMRLSALVMFGASIHVPTAGSLRGAGDTVSPLVASLCSLWLCRVILGYLLVVVGGFGVMAVRLSCALDQLVRAAIVFFRYLTGRWARAAAPKPEPGSRAAERVSHVQR